ncbi:hypothetical protein MNEG_12779 [Monoraphidium neglectum]|uniref:Uncharacterized protein n=1 Tax=Monoraphidium neglectum TaxID=145388 RepID=A0A0D2KHF3_9CHLO|nr:hypothetical protein MNEG_12779 [Monoraphidium neglectum]KIY95183.1 hypothetical protein MNEG_12779 [Monoraphidium neglectum]|eukprot:XP_013894203.1 hypothetical protein MNEG_12779 [Monoraphidium neglectum]
MGDWHLQSIQDAAPWAQERLLLGPFGPEALTARHGLDERQCLALYGLLQRHTAGFQSEAAALVAGAAHREQLLAGLWRTFAQLWDDSVQAAFSGEVASAMAELQGTHEALLAAQDRLEDVLAENR